MRPPSDPFFVGVIQDHATADKAANVARAERLVRDAAGRGAQIICLKEMFNAPYFCKSQQSERFDLAEPIPGPTTDAMTRLARELAVVLIVPIFERQAAGVYRNSAAVIGCAGRGSPNCSPLPSSAPRSSRRSSRRADTPPRSERCR